MPASKAAERIALSDDSGICFFNNSDAGSSSASCGTNLPQRFLRRQVGRPQLERHRINHLNSLAQNSLRHY
jgi:hypothetical protein